MNNAIKWIGALAALFLVASIIVYATASPEKKAAWKAEAEKKDATQQAKKEAAEDAQQTAITGQAPDVTMLNKATVIQWQSASNESKLATSKDFVNRARKAGGKGPLNGDSLRTAAITLMQCINEAYMTKAAAPLKANDVAAACLVIADK